MTDDGEVHPGTLTIGDLVIDPGSREVTLGGRSIVLTFREFELLFYLARHPGWVFSPEQLVRDVWGYDFVGDTRPVSVHMANIRKKLGTTPTHPVVIETVRGAGYKLAKPASPTASVAGAAVTAGANIPAGAAAAAGVSLPAGAVVGAGAVPAVRPSPAFVDRGEELRVLLDALQAAENRTGSFVLIWGETGIGKTTLAQQLAYRTAERGALLLRACCHEVTAASPYWPWIQCLRSLPEVLPGDDLTRYLATGSADLAGLAPELAATVAASPLDGHAAVSPAAARAPMFDSIARLVRRMAAERLVVIILDDLEWCDQASLPVLEVLSDDIAGMRLLVVVTLEDERATRSSLRETLAGLAARGSRRIHLRGLSPEATAQLIELTTGERPSASAAEAVFRQSDGNPFYVTEFARLSSSAGEVQLTPWVRDIASKRLAAIDPACRAMLGLAALLGRAFEVRLLRAVAGSRLQTLLDQLQQAVDAHLIEGEGTPGRFRFVHPTVRQALLAELGDVRRLTLHASIAQALELADLSETHLAEIAYHYAQSAAVADAGKALELSRRAAASCMAQGAFDEAAGHFRTAHDLLTLVDVPTNERAQLATSLCESEGDAWLLASRGQQALEAYQQALLVLPPDSGTGRARLYRKIGNAWQAEQKPHPALDALGTAERALPAHRDSWPADVWLEWIEIQLARADSCYFRGDAAQLGAVIESIQEALASQGTETQRNRAAAFRLSLAFREERYAVGAHTVELAERQWVRSQESGSLDEQCSAEFSFGFALLWNRRVEEARSHLLSSDELARRLRIRRLQVLNAAYLSVAARLAGNLDETELWAGRTTAQAGEAHLAGYLAVAKANLAWLALQRGSEAESERMAREALALWEAPSAYPFEWLARWPLVAVSLRRDEVAEAVEQAGAMLAPRQQSLPDDIADALAAAVAAWQQSDAPVTCNLLAAALASSARVA